jgi:hypothetical protein
MKGSVCSAIIEAWDCEHVQREGLHDEAEGREKTIGKK